jgi:hypothetical protein
LKGSTLLNLVLFGSGRLAASSRVWCQAVEDLDEPQLYKQLVDFLVSNGPSSDPLAVGRSWVRCFCRFRASEPARYKVLEVRLQR